MRVHLVKAETIFAFASRYPFCRSAFSHWLYVLKFARWRTPEDIKRSYASADFLGNGTNRVVFDISGNNYRMICKYVFGLTEIHLFICWIGTHEAYDKICSKRLQYTCSDY